MALPDNSGQGPYMYPITRDPEFKSKIVFQAIKVLPPKFTASFFASSTADEIKDGDKTPERKASSEEIKVALKKGAPTETLPPPTASNNNG